MPRRFERHKTKSSWGSWNTEPARSDQVREAARDDPQPARKAPARKDTRSWCKGKVGREHVLVLVFVPDYTSRHGQVCQWASVWSIRGQEYRLGWKCRHREECINCGRVFREHYDLKREECLAYPGSEEQRAQAEAQVERDRERRASWRAQPRWRRLIVTGPQHYRRKREGA